MPDLPLIIRQLGEVEYLPAWHAMQRFTETRSAGTADEIWLLQHPPVFTQGQAGRAEHILDAGDIPVVQVDRGGQVTYHGPGQLVAYLLIDLRRRRLGVRQLVTIIEQAVVQLLADYAVAASPRNDAPGVYVDLENGLSGAKIAQLGLRVRRGCSFHGLSLNVAMDTRPFQRINPCGHAGLAVTTLAQQGVKNLAMDAIGRQLTEHLMAKLAYNRAQYNNNNQRFFGELK